MGSAEETDTVAREEKARLQVHEQSQGRTGASARPEDVGILALEVYFPRSKVGQDELERFDGVPPGKYTVGLGQRAMAFTEDQEDVVSMSLTVVSSLLKKFQVSPDEVGRLEVGTESSVDRSKSVKSFLMSLFSQSGNSDVQGVDCINACYGGTAALFNAVNWVESRSWDGRFAIVVAADVAVYAQGPARASGGCGAVAMLIGPDAPLVLEPGFSAAYMDNVYDFYKPAGMFPQVEGKLSIACYLTALDRCYSRLCQKIERLCAFSSSTSGEPARTFSLQEVDYCVMHAPFAKMVRKGFARLALQDCLRSRQRSRSPNSRGEDRKPERKPTAQPGCHPVVRLEADTTAREASQGGEPPTASHRSPAMEHLHRVLDAAGAAGTADVENREVGAAAVDACAADFERMAAPGMLLGLECGNMYAASVHSSLASLVYSKGAALEGKRILTNSFGSGLAASIFCMRGRAATGRFSLEDIARKLDLQRRLAARRACSPQEFTAALSTLERIHGMAGFKPSSNPRNLFPGTFFLQEVDERFRRKYGCVEDDCQQTAPNPS